MALTRNNVALGTIPVPNPIDASDITFRSQLSIVAGAFAIGDIIELGSLPAGAVVVDAVLDTDVLTLGVVSIGLLNAAKTDLDLTTSGGAAWLTGQSTGTAGSFRADSLGLKAALRMTKADVNRPYGIKVTTAITSSTGIIGVALTYKAG
jgi:hypothetical protein